MLFGLCNADEAVLLPFSAFKHTVKYFSIWMAYQCFMCSLLRLAHSCKQGIIGIDKCVKGIRGYKFKKIFAPRQPW